MKDLGTAAALYYSRSLRATEGFAIYVRTTDFSMRYGVPIVVLLVPYSSSSSYELSVDVAREE